MMMALYIVLVLSMLAILGVAVAVYVRVRKRTDMHRLDETNQALARRSQLNRPVSHPRHD